MLRKIKAQGKENSEVGILNRHDLEKLRALKSEIKSIELGMISPKPTMQTIFYKDYRHNPKGIPKSDSGYDDGGADYDMLEKLMIRKIRERSALVQDIEMWIESIDDPGMRTILRYYYRDGLSQQEIGTLLGYERSSIAQKIKRFWMHVSHNSH